MRYSIVIPTYNHCDKYLKPCLDAIFKYSSISDIELIISANGCKDNTFDFLNELKLKFDYLGLENNLKIVWHDEAIGYAKATNAGIKVATTNKIVLLNNDAILIYQGKNDWLNYLESSFIKLPNCAVSAVLFRHSEITLRQFGVFFCVMVDRKVFDTIGLLDEDFEVGGSEDIDFCMRAELAGFVIDQPLKMIWNDEAMTHIGSFPIYHRGEGTVHDTSLVQNWDKIFKKNELRLAQKYNLEYYELHKNEI